MFGQQAHLYPGRFSLLAVPAAAISWATVQGFSDAGQQGNTENSRNEYCLFFGFTSSLCFFLILFASLKDGCVETMKANRINYEFLHEKNQLKAFREILDGLCFFFIVLLPCDGSGEVYQVLKSLPEYSNETQKGLYSSGWRKDWSHRPGSLCPNPPVYSLWVQYKLMTSREFCWGCNNFIMQAGILFAESIFLIGFM